MQKRTESKKMLLKGKWWRTFLGKRPPNTPKTLSWHLSPAQFFKHFVSIKIENFPQHNEKGKLVSVMNITWQNSFSGSSSSPKTSSGSISIKFKPVAGCLAEDVRFLQKKNEGLVFHLYFFSFFMGLYRIGARIAFQSNNTPFKIFFLKTISHMRIHLQINVTLNIDFTLIIYINSNLKKYFSLTYFFYFLILPIYFIYINPL